MTPCERGIKLNQRQRRKRRVELLIDQRLLGFIKPKMTISLGGTTLQTKPQIDSSPATEPRQNKRRENRAS